MELIEAIQLILNETKTFFSPWGYTIIDLGIVKYHFEIGAGKEKFTWL